MNWHRLRQHISRPAIIYTFVAIMILLPLLRHGYVLTLDMIFTPTIAVPDTSTPTYAFYGLLHILNNFIAADILQKLLLMTIIVLAGLGAHRLILQDKPQKATINWQVIGYFAGLTYILNPFTYSRFMAGQYLVLLGYAFLPFFIAAGRVFLQRPGFRTAAWSALWITLIGILSLHLLGVALMFAICLCVPTLWQRRHDKVWLLAWARGTLGAIGIAMLLSASWLLPFFFGDSHTAHVAQSFSEGDRLAFATAGHGWAKIVNIVTLQGFWADGRSLYITARELYWWWWLPQFVLMALVVVGVRARWYAQRAVTIGFIAAMAVAMIVACGTGGTIFASLNRWMTDTVPFFDGYREPQKFVAVIALGYAYFGAHGLAALWRRAIAAKHTIQTHDVIAATVVLTILLSPLMLWGFHGQLSATEYPRDWYQVNAQLQTLPAGKVLFLPWHQYMRFGFAGRVIANPSDRFFASELVSSNNPELTGLDNWHNSTTQATIERHILPTAHHGGSVMAQSLKQLNIHYVLLAKENDFRDYAYLDRQPGLQVVQNTAHLRLYEVRTTIGKVGN